MTPTRRTALLAGGLYLLTFATSIPALVLKGPALHDPEFVLGVGRASGVLWAGMLELVLAVACVGTAVVLFGVARRQSEAAALGFVAARVLEAVLIVVGVLSLLTVVTLRDVAGAGDAAALVAIGRALIALHDWTFLLGPGLIPAINALCLGYVLYRAALVPRAIPAMGLVGAPLLVASAVATTSGVFDPVSVWAAVAALPIAAWELSLGVWLLLRGFRSEGLARLAAGHHDVLAARVGSLPVGGRP